MIAEISRPRRSADAREIMCELFNFPKCTKAVVDNVLEFLQFSGLIFLSTKGNVVGCFARQFFFIERQNITACHVRQSLVGTSLGPTSQNP